MKCDIIFPSLLRSSRSNLFHIRFTGESGGGLPAGEVSAGDIDGVVSDTSAVSSVLDMSIRGGTWSTAFVPRLRPSKFVVGVPVTIQRRSTLNIFANGTRLVVNVDETWPSSIIRRFHLICKKGEMPGTWHEQFGILKTGNSGQVQAVRVYNFETSCTFDSAVNPVEILPSKF